MLWKREHAGRYHCWCGEMRYTIRKVLAQWEVYVLRDHTARYIASNETLTKAKQVAYRYQQRTLPSNVFEFFPSMRMVYFYTEDRTIHLHTCQINRLTECIADQIHPEAFRHLLCVARDAAIDAGYLPQEG